VPVVIFTNTPHSDFSQTDAKSSITVKKVTNYTKSPMDQLEEVAYYEGSENPVTRDAECIKVPRPTRSLLKSASLQKVPRKIPNGSKLK
jgi:hypothetical protein